MCKDEQQLQGQHVLLVDDVATTELSLEACMLAMRIVAIHLFQYLQ